MRRLRALATRLAGSLGLRRSGSDASDADMRAELESHLELQTAENVRRGMTPEEARRHALIASGGLAHAAEAMRDQYRVPWIESILRDLRHAARGLRRTPGFTVSAVGVLALGIGSTTAVFSAANAVLRNPTHDGLAIIHFRGFPSLSTADFRAIEEQQRSFSALGAMRGGAVAFRARGDAERVRGGRVTAGWFDVLGLRPVAGRPIEPRDEVLGADRVAVLSDELARRTFGDPSAALGRAVQVDEVPHLVIGVLPRVSEPLATRADVWSALQLAPPERRGPFGMMVIARLAPGVTFESATRDVAGISERIFPLWAPAWNDRTARYEARAIRTAALATSSRMLGIFGAAVALVLLIGVANVASLMLVRAVGRSREVLLRAALGASRTQLVRLFVTESALLALASAAIGIGIGVLGLRALIALGPSMPGLSAGGLDVRAALFAVVLALVAGLIVGAYPVALLLRGERRGLSTSARVIGGGRATQAVRSGFVVGQFALALPLLAISGLLLVSFLRLQRVDPGFDPGNVLTVRVSLPSGTYSSDELTEGYWARALPVVQALPGVRDVGLGSSMPPDDFGSSNDNFNLIDRPVPPGTPEPNGAWPAADAGYFAALGVPILEGRLFTPADSGPEPVVVVSRTWAEKYYPGESALGRRMIRGGCTECSPSTVVGVVDDVRYNGFTGALDALYSPVNEVWPTTLYLFIRTEGRPEPLMSSVRRVLTSVDPAVPLDDLATMEQRLYASTAQPRQWAILLGAFAAAALALAALGVFGMLSYMVHARRREIGVRIALGARGASVVRLVVGKGFAHAILGSIIGLGAALAGTRALTTVLYDVSPADPRTLGLATLALLVVALIACWLPARRAAAIDPLEIMRDE